MRHSSFASEGIRMTTFRSGGQSEIRAGATRKLLRTIASALQITDLLALMMVLATALSAYATWKMTQLTNEILLSSQCPYIGTESVSLVGTPSPKVMTDLRNFGSVQAEHAEISIVLRVNGKALSLDSEPQRQDSPVILSPGVPHRFYRHLSQDTTATPCRERRVWWSRSRCATEDHVATSIVI
jgi:hypothetical protein